MSLSKRSADEKEFFFGDDDFDFFAKMATEKTGIVLDRRKKDMVYSRLTRRLRALNFNDFKAYREYLSSGRDKNEMDHFINSITTNLTSFFRENHHFEHLEQELLKLKNGPAKKLRLWSCACSAGMEPYSMAMVLNKTIPSAQKWGAKILATDIDSNMLNTGISGEYNISDIEKIDDGYQKFYDVKDGSKIVIKDAIKELVAFRYLNLLESWPMKGQFDFVFCRNVVIYFDRETKETLFNRIADLMADGAYLYIGHSENLGSVNDRFASMGRTTYRKIK